jgi:glycosyltransferase involved in cell wall biosynthesis
MRKKIFYTSIYSPSQISEWSGLGYHIHSMLKMQGLELELVSPLAYNPSAVVKIISRVNKNLVLPREKSVIKNYAIQIEQKIKNRNGVIFSPGTLPVAYYKGSNPVVIYTDATFASIAGYYTEFKNWAARAIRTAHEIEKAALHRADLLLYASDWAAQSAINDYGIDPGKVRVVPFGANIKEIPDNDTVLASIQKKVQKTLEILFVGVDWKRKGGDKVLEVFDYIRKKGIDARLHIAGPHTSPIKEARDDIFYYGFLDKHDENDEKLLQSLFSNAHFFVMLSESECYGLVYCEANAYGTPVVGFNTGGVSTIITEANGVLLDIATKKEEISELLISLFENKNRYYNLCVSSYKMFANKFNWHHAGYQIKQLLENL